MLLIAKNISKKYGSLQVLDDVSVSIEEGKVVSIVGASGAGKSSLLHILGTLDQADKGTVFFRGENLGNLSEKKLAAFRNTHLGFVFQFHHLLPEFTALENICMPAFIKNTGKKEAEKRGLELLELLKLKDRAHHKPSELSGGEQQRVAVARALMNKPAIVLADEPSGNLDSDNAKSLHQLFFDLRKELNQTFVIVTHNQDLAKMADSVIVMKDGKIVSTELV